MSLYSEGHDRAHADWHVKCACAVRHEQANTRCAQHRSSVMMLGTWGLFQTPLCGLVAEWRLPTDRLATQVMVPSIRPQARNHHVFTLAHAGAPLAEAAQDGDGLVDGGRLDQDLLEPPLQGLVLLDIPACGLDACAQACMQA